MTERDWRTDPPPINLPDDPPPRTREPTEPTYAPIAQPLPKWVILLAAVFGISMILLVAVNVALKVYISHVQSKTLTP